MSLYLLLLLASVSVPLLLSFDKKLQFYRQWKWLIPSISVVAIYYIIWDIYLTSKGVWGFNPRYHGSIMISGIPLEEALFFIIIPYASLFLHYSFILYFPAIKLPEKSSQIISIALVIISLSILIFNFNKAYTAYILPHFIIAVFLGISFKPRLLQSFLFSFILICVPFLIVNGILTGSFIDEEVVWYENSENLGIRLGTIPIEDFAYGFSMIFFSLIFTESLKDRFQQSN